MKTIDKIPTSKIERAGQLVKTGLKVGGNYISYYSEKIIHPNLTKDKLNENNNPPKGPGDDPTKTPGNPNGLITGKGVLGGAGGNGGAGSGGSGYEYSFFREMKAKPVLDETVTVEGSILVNVIVDKSGKVIDASVDVANSKYNGGSSKAELNRLAIKAAKSAKFASDPNGGANKSGKITINFKLK